MEFLVVYLISMVVSFLSLCLIRIYLDMQDLLLGSLIGYLIISVVPVLNTVVSCFLLFALTMEFISSSKTVVIKARWRK